MPIFQLPLYDVAGVFEDGGTPIVVNEDPSGFSTLTVGNNYTFTSVGTAVIAEVDDDLDEISEVDDTQDLASDVTIGGTTYTAGTQIGYLFEVVFEDGPGGTQYVLYGIGVETSTPGVGTSIAYAWRDGIVPPDNTTLTVVSEGQPTPTTYSSFSTEDGIVDGSSLADTIDGSYTGDPDGDRVDNNDAIAGTINNPTAGSNEDLIYGYGGNDVIYSGNSADLVYGGIGGDTINAGNGLDIVYGGDGDDRVFLTSGSNVDGRDTVYGGEGLDTLTGHNEAQTIYGDGGDDIISGDSDVDGFGGSETGTNTSEIDFLYGGAGNDIIYSGYQGANSTTTSGDFIDGGIGNDLIFGGTEDDTINGGTGNDTIDGGDGSDGIDAGDGNDVVLGGLGIDALTGGAGADTLDGGAGADEIEGGDGDDQITVRAGDKGVAGNDSDTFVLDFTGASSGSSATIDGSTGGTDVDRIDFNGLTFLGYVGTPTTDLDGDSTSGAFQVGDGINTYTVEFNEIEIICFTRGTLIRTLDGEVPIESLAVDQKVLTQDCGYQPIRWIGGRKVSRAELEANPKLLPIRIRAGALGDGRPEQDLLVSRQHRVLVRSKIAERMFGTAEVLVAVNKLMAVDGIDIAWDVEEVEYWHFLLDQHQVVWSNGAPTESLFTGPEALRAVSPEAREEIMTIFPEICAPDFHTVAARLIPEKGNRIKNLARRHQKSRQPLFVG